MTRERRSVLQMIHGLKPFGVGETKPHHFLDMARIAWQNRDNLGYAWRILNDGVCDGCALGTSGLSDWTISGTHLCLVRLELLRLNTMRAFDSGLLSDVSKFEGKTSREMREMGRLGYPMRRRAGEKGFTRITWDLAFKEIGERWRGLDPSRTSMFVTSRGITNEVYYTAQKVMRLLGSNNVDNSARLCHSPSTSGLKSTVGVAATTCSYRDFFDADLIVFFGSNPANDQPVSTKYLHEAKSRGARVLMVNPYREPGMSRYWIPSNLDSALFGTNLTDRFFQVRIGGDLAFLCAVQKLLIEAGAVKTDFIESATVGYAELKANLEAMSFDELVQRSGCSAEDIRAFADELATAERGIFVWSMGITQHQNGTQNVQAIVNTALLREYIGRPGCGLMPIRGHSGVQGGAEMGAYASVFPGGVTINEESAARFSELWGFEVPSKPGITTVQTFEAAARGEIDAFYCIGGNFLETMPDPETCHKALESIPLRIHSDIVLTSQMLVPPKETVYIFPARTRYEQRDGGTETSTERRVIFSPYIPGHDVGEARSEWELLLELARAVAPEKYEKVHFESGQAIREDIAAAVPFYSEIKSLKVKGDQFQWGGPRLCEGRRFPTSDGKAHFIALSLPAPSEDGVFRLATRRGKQFNSMIQSWRDPLTGAERDHLFISSRDAQRLGIAPDSPITLKNEHGEYRGRAFLVDMPSGTIQGHWPEVNPLLPLGPVDGGGGVPDYNADVRIEV